LNQLLAMIPQPVKAILLLFPARGDIEKNRIAVDEKIAKDGQHEVDPTLLFITQTVGF
jgi:ubiquitin carboxyl-terminal hydrolase L3